MDGTDDARLADELVRQHQASSGDAQAYQRWASRAMAFLRAHRHWWCRHGELALLVGELYKHHDQDAVVDLYQAMEDTFLECWSCLQAYRDSEARYRAEFDLEEVTPILQGRCVLDSGRLARWLEPGSWGVGTLEGGDDVERGVVPRRVQLGLYECMYYHGSLGDSIVFLAASAALDRIVARNVSLEIPTVDQGPWPPGLVLLLAAPHESTRLYVEQMLRSAVAPGSRPATATAGALCDATLPALDAWLATLSSDKLPPPAPGRRPPTFRTEDIWFAINSVLAALSKAAVAPSRSENDQDDRGPVAALVAERPALLQVLLRAVSRDTTVFHRAQSALRVVLQTAPRALHWASAGGACAALETVVPLARPGAPKVRISTAVACARLAPLLAEHAVGAGEVDELGRVLPETVQALVPPIAAEGIATTTGRIGALAVVAIAARAGAANVARCAKTLGPELGKALKGTEHLRKAALDCVSAVIASDVQRMAQSASKPLTALFDGEIAALGGAASQPLDNLVCPDFWDQVARCGDAHASVFLLQASGGLAMSVPATPPRPGDGAAASGAPSAGWLREGRLVDEQPARGRAGLWLRGAWNSVPATPIRVGALLSALHSAAFAAAQDLFGAAAGDGKQAQPGLPPALARDKEHLVAGVRCLAIGTVSVDSTVCARSTGLLRSAFKAAKYGEAVCNALRHASQAPRAGILSAAAMLVYGAVDYMQQERDDGRRLVPGADRILLFLSHVLRALSDSGDIPCAGQTGTLPRDDEAASLITTIQCASWTLACEAVATLAGSSAVGLAQSSESLLVPSLVVIDVLAPIAEFHVGSDAGARDPNFDLTNIEDICLNMASIGRQVFHPAASAEYVRHPWLSATTKLLRVLRTVRGAAGHEGDALRRQLQTVCTAAASAAPHFWSKVNALVHGLPAPSTATRLATDLPRHPAAAPSASAGAKHTPPAKTQNRGLADSLRSIIRSAQPSTPPSSSKHRPWERRSAAAAAPLPNSGAPPRGNLTVYVGDSCSSDEDDDCELAGAGDAAERQARPKTDSETRKAFLERWRKGGESRVVLAPVVGLGRRPAGRVGLAGGAGASQRARQARPAITVREIMDDFLPLGAATLLSRRPPWRLPKLPSTFAGLQEYARAFVPLLLEELRSHVGQAWEEKGIQDLLSSLEDQDGVEEGEITAPGPVQSVGLLIEGSHSEAAPGGVFRTTLSARTSAASHGQRATQAGSRDRAPGPALQAEDLVLLYQRPGAPAGDKKAVPYLIAWVDTVDADVMHGAHKVVLRTLLSVPRSADSGNPAWEEDRERRRAAAGLCAQTRGQVQGVRLCSLTTHVREFSALANMHRLSQGIQSAILGQPPPRRDTAPPTLLSAGLPLRLRGALERRFNGSQLDAIARAASTAAGFTLVQGPPGTGKTSAILGIISALSACVRGPPPEVTPVQLTASAPGECAVTAARAGRSGARILVCAQSNAACDELVLRLTTSGLLGADGEVFQPTVVRMGRVESVTLPDVRPYHIDAHCDSAVRADAGQGAARDDATAVRDQVETLRARLREINQLIAATENSRDLGKNLDGQDSVQELRAKRRQVRDDLLAHEALQRSLGQRAAAASRDLRRRVVAGADVVVATLSTAGGELAQLLLAQGASMGVDARRATLIDAIVVDEAAQALEPATLIPLQLLSPSGRVVLVGDPQQLPATLLSQAAAGSLLGRSLFERLQSLGHGCAMLTEQYRMHPEISAFPSTYFYDGCLRDGEGVQGGGRAAAFHAQAAFPPVCFWDVRDGRMSRRGASLSNAEEADLAAVLLGAALRGSQQAGLTAAVLSPYAAQVALLKSRYSASSTASEAAAADVQFATVDAFQGREADIVILSCVRAGSTGHTSSVGFLADVRRMNVALTRAKRALWILGHAETLCNNPAWLSLLEDLSGRGCVYCARKPWAALAGAKDRAALRTQLVVPPSARRATLASRTGGASAPRPAPATHTHDDKNMINDTSAINIPSSSIQKQPRVHPAGAPEQPPRRRDAAPAPKATAPPPKATAPAPKATAPAPKATAPATAANPQPKAAPPPISTEKKPTPPPPAGVRSRVAAPSKIAEPPRVRLAESVPRQAARVVARAGPKAIGAQARSVLGAGGGAGRGAAAGGRQAARGPVAPRDFTHLAGRGKRAATEAAGAAPPAKRQEGAKRDLNAPSGGVAGGGQEARKEGGARRPASGSVLKGLLGSIKKS
ncbi:unnamed protein product [Pedinophyceae sp. YPF-701]|nr:unnamed protein product [Pedinophyceae sp. YPF-701]